MSIPGTGRRIFLAVTLSLSVIAAAWVALTEPPQPTVAGDASAPPVPVRVGRGAEPARETFAVHLLDDLRKERLSNEGEPALFRSAAWQSPARPAQPGPSTAKQPPPIDFAYGFMGKMAIPGRPTKVFLTRGDLPMSVAIGERVDDEFELKAITDTHLEVTHTATGKLLSLSLATLSRSSASRPAASSRGPSGPPSFDGPEAATMPGMAVSPPQVLTPTQPQFPPQIAPPITPELVGQPAAEAQPAQLAPANAPRPATGMEGKPIAAPFSARISPNTQIPFGGTSPAPGSDGGTPQ